MAQPHLHESDLNPLPYIPEEVSTLQHNPPFKMEEMYTHLLRVMISSFLIAFLL